MYSYQTSDEVCEHLHCFEKYLFFFRFESLLFSVILGIILASFGILIFNVFS